MAETPSLGTVMALVANAQVTVTISHAGEPALITCDHVTKAEAATALLTLGARLRAEVAAEQ